MLRSRYVLIYNYMNMNTNLHWHPADRKCWPYNFFFKNELLLNAVSSSPLSWYVTRGYGVLLDVYVKARFSIESEQVHSSEFIWSSWSATEVPVASRFQIAFFLLFEIFVDFFILSIWIFLLAWWPIFSYRQLRKLRKLCKNYKLAWGPSCPF